MKFYYLLIVSFIFIATSALSFKNFHKPNPAKASSSEKREVRVFSPVPVLDGNDHFPIMSAQSVLAIDIVSGVTLYEKNPDEKLLPASTTKIVTALVALDYYNLDQVLTVGNIKVEGQKMRLVSGEKMTVKDLLYGLLVFSANDAAEVLAENFPGGRKSFIAAMNLKAEELSLNNTYFSNPSGLEGLGHVSTARDLTRASEVALKNSFFRKVVATKEIQLTSVDGQIKHKIRNINELIGQVEGVLGVKTGWTENARENLVAYVERGNRKIMTVVLGSQDRFGETRELIEWIFSNYEWKEVAPVY